ncbi:MAG: hypothetical protein ACXV1K_09710 [Kineosporiaceae bacterium]
MRERIRATLSATDQDTLDKGPVEAAAAFTVDPAPAAAAPPGSA